MSDTPRTDEQINGKPCTRFAILAGDSLRDAFVPSEFCRELERELNAANERIKRLEEAGDALEYASVILEAGEDPNGFEKLLIAQRAWHKAKDAKP